MGWLRKGAVLFAVLAGLSAPLAPAQQGVSLQLSGVPRGVEPDEDEDPALAQGRLRIAEMAVTARIAGPLADVEIEMLIAPTDPDDDEELEARLALDLPQDAVVTGYALNVEQAMIPGQLLEQAKARNVYEDEVRKGIDPGLAEVSARNRFATQVYPVTAEAPRRVRLRFSAPFDPSKGLDLPLDTKLAVGSARVTVSAQGYAAAPQLRLGGQDLALRREGNTWRGESRVENARLEGGLSLRGVRQPGQMLITRHANGKRFFTILGQAEAAAPAKTGGRLRIYWDRSRSHQGKAAADEAEALVALAEQTRPEAIDLVTFASNAPQVTTLADAAALREALGKVTYRGATSLAGLDNLKLPDARRCVLVSDGQVTLDRAAPFRPDCRLSTLSADSGADGARLGRLAQRQGGQFVRIAPGKGREAATALSDSGVSVIAVTSEASGRIGWRAFSQADGGWMVVGEMPFDTRLPSAAPVTVRVVSPSGRISEESFAPDMAALPLDAGGALWAATRVGELADDPAQHEAMVALSRAFQVASPAMAFLVLETPEQYLNADIAPPRGFPEEWMEEYKEAKASRDEDKQTARADRLETVLELWGERKAWWNTRFPLPRSKGGANGQEQQAVPVGAPPPPPSPPPPPVLNRPNPESRETVSESGGEEMDANDSLVVTASRVSNPRLSGATPVNAIDGQGSDADVEIKLETVLADRPYLKALDAAAPEARQGVLAEQEAQYGSVPAFYFDTADWFRLKGDAATARELMLSALELDKADNETLQIVAFRLERDGEYDLAVQLAERLAVGAKFLPQPRRALALALAARGTAAGKNGRADLERAFALLVEVALEPTDSGEYDGLEVIALMEANALIPRIEALGGTWKLDRRLVGLFDTDARIVIEWTADDADIDLWVDEPGGERVMYSNKQSDFGGQISNDMTDGYGPEEYAIRRAPKGEYRVRVNGYDADRINPNGPGHVLVRLIRNHGRRSEKAVLVDVDLSFQEGPNRDQAEKTRPIAVMTVN